MPVHKDSVRYFAEEQETINYQDGDPAFAGWVPLAAWPAIFRTLRHAVLVFQAGFTLDGSGNGGTRIKITNRLHSTVYYVGGRLENSVGDYVYSGICYLPDIDTGWDVEYEGRECAAEVSNAWLKLGLTNFSDLSGDQLNQLLNQTIGSMVTTTVIDEDIVGEQRLTCIGTLQKHVIRVQVVVICDDAQKGVFVDELTDGLDFAVGIKIDGTQMPWTAKEDDVSTACSGATYGEYVFEQDIQDSVNIKIEVSNNDGGGHDYDIYWSIAACPWFSYAEYAAPVLVNLPTASTINALLEPLDLDIEDKYIGLGTLKALGEDKVYDEQTGIGIVSMSKTLTELPQHGLKLMHKGFRSAVTVIVADRR